MVWTVLSLLALISAPSVALEAEPSCSKECPVESVTLVIDDDPGHYGARTRYEVVAGAATKEVKLERWPARIDRTDGAPIPDDQWTSEVLVLDRTAKEIHEFLAGLAARHACSLGSPDSLIGLHPEFLTLRLRDACGTEHSIEWIEEGRHSPSDLHRGLREHFEAFFRHPD